MNAFTETQSYGWVFDITTGLIRAVFLMILWRYLAQKKKKWIFVLLLLVVIPTALYLSQHIDTRIDETGVHYIESPSLGDEQMIRWDEIQHIAIIKPGNIFNTKRAHIYMLSTGSRYAADIKCTDGRRIIIGTNLPDEMDAKLLELLNNRILPESLRHQSNTFISQTIAE